MFHKYSSSYGIYDFIGLWGCILFITKYNPVDYVYYILLSTILAKIYTLSLLYEKIEVRIKIHLNGFGNYLWELMKLLFNAFIICHIISCMYYLLGVYEYHVME